MKNSNPTIDAPRPDSNSVSITLNGSSFSLTIPATVASLVAIRGPRPPFAVELNKTLIRRPQYESTILNAGDSVEIVTLVGGG